MTLIETILNKKSKKNMLLWNQEKFKRTHPSLYKTIIETCEEILKVKRPSEPWIRTHLVKPPVNERIRVVCKSGEYIYQTIATYIPFKTVKEEGFMHEDFFGEGDYDEETDEYYTPEGFYEWQSVPDIHWKISDEVTHWLPLTKLP